MPQEWRINALVRGKEEAARPSSNHGKIVNMLFCDGSVRCVSQSVDAHLYLKLLTPHGQEWGEHEVANER